MEILGFLWNEGLIRPMSNSLVLLYLLFFNNFGLSIIAFTIIIRVLTIPLTIRQTKQTRAMASLQPKLKDLQQRLAGDRQRLSQETFRLYRENGVNPIGCLGPLVIQMPIFIALYWSLIKVLPSNPESIISLANVLYSSLDIAQAAVPLNSQFLGMDLAQMGRDAGPIGFVLALFVGVSMWIQQKMMTYPNSDPRQAQTQQMMLWMMPVMLAFFTFQFPNGLALYWVATNFVGIGIQSRITGFTNLMPKRKRPTETPQEVIQEPTPVKELEDHGEHGSIRQNSGRSNRDQPKTTRRRPRRGGGRGR